MSPQYQQWSDYFWPDAPDVLRNRLGLKNAGVLNYVETMITYVRIYEHVLNQPASTTYDFAAYQDVHRHIFGDIYDWAGQPRTVPAGPMIKQHRDVVNHPVGDPTAPMVPCRYYPGPHVADGAETVFEHLGRENALTGLDQPHFVDRLATYWGALDRVHPFREGNTRSQTLFFHSLARNAGYDLGANLLRQRRVEFISARFHGHSTGRYDRLRELLGETVEPRQSRELTPRELKWANELGGQAREQEERFRRIAGIAGPTRSDSLTHDIL